LLPTVTPDAGTKVVFAVPISTKLYLYPTGILAEEFSGTVKFIGDDALSKIVLLTSRASKVNPVVLITTVLLFNNDGSRSNLELPPFQSIPFPARSEYAPVVLFIASVKSDCVTKSAVFGIPCTFTVAELCAAIAAFLFTISKLSAAVLFTTSRASASTRVFRWFATDGIGRGPGTGAAAS
jgi:hypothetical protein